MKSWGPDDMNAALKDLEVDSFTTDATKDTTLPFYTRLGKTLELLQARGSRFE